MVRFAFMKNSPVRPCQTKPTLPHEVKRRSGKTAAAGDKRANGRYFTAVNLFDTRHFRAWAAQAGLPQATLIEPFAGRGDLVRMLRDLDLCGRVRAYDIAPAGQGVKPRDTLAAFPHGNVVVTNPPWLARNSATRRGLPFPATRYDDLYKHCLAICLKNADHVAAIIPASFLSSGLFRRRLCGIDIATRPVFTDTENPVCLALFSPQESADVAIHHSGAYVGKLSDFERHLPRPAGKIPLQFNAPAGRLGLIAIDNTRAPSIRFCRGSDLRGYPIGNTSRMITRIAGEFDRNVNALAERLNEKMAEFRRETYDVYLTPFKGLRKDGFYRRRLSFGLAADFIRFYR